MSLEIFLSAFGSGWGAPVKKENSAFKPLRVAVGFVVQCWAEPCKMNERCPCAHVTICAWLFWTSCTLFFRQLVLSLTFGLLMFALNFAELHLHYKMVFTRQFILYIFAFAALKPTGLQVCEVILICCCLLLLVLTFPLSIWFCFKVCIYLWEIFFAISFLGRW